MKLSAPYKTNRNEPINTEHGIWNDEKSHTHSGRGLTKREYFAALAMQGFTATAPFQVDSVNKYIELRAVDAVHAADALIEALNKEESTKL